MLIDEIYNKQGIKPYKHQLEAADALSEGKPIVIRAPCGSGKTEACLLPFLAGQEQKIPKRLIYSLPTRVLVEDIACRTQRAILNINPELEFSRQHGAASDDPFFKKSLIFTTIDQTVGAYCCTPLSAPVRFGNIPAGATVSSLLCFDEVHTYDHNLGLQTMLILVERAQRMNVPFVVMSATLPDSFIQYFKSQGIQVSEVSDVNIPKRKDRDVRVTWEGESLTSAKVIEAFKNNKKVMVVCNTVLKAQQIYSELNDEKIHLIHSRFTVEDRKKNEGKAIKAFKDHDSAYLITTQVCEVGLDISCEVLFTELAPPDALIQRIGRCARDGKQGKVFIYDVEHPAPYNEGIINQTRNKIRDFKAKKFGWGEELDLINGLLDEPFSKIMKDENRRKVLLNRLGYAAFSGDRSQVENSVREVLSANIAIYDKQFISKENVWNLPWISIDIRVLQRAMKEHQMKLYKINIEYSENNNEESLNIRDVTTNYSIQPYQNYIITPESAKYDPKIGLIFGKKGENMSLIHKKGDERHEYVYKREPWKTHINNCLSAFEKIKETEFPRRLYSNLLKCDEKRAEGIIVLAIALHDLGKLNISWQSSMGIKENALEPLAHSNVRSNRPPGHAVVSGFSSSKLFQDLLGKNHLRRAVILAISHHHSVRSYECDRYKIGWRNIVNEIIGSISDKYDLDINSNNLIWEEKRGSLDQTFPDIEKETEYPLYAITSRLIRLSDQESFNISEKY